MTEETRPPEEERAPETEPVVEAAPETDPVAAAQPEGAPETETEPAGAAVREEAPETEPVVEAEMTAEAEAPVAEPAEPSAELPTSESPAADATPEARRSKKRLPRPLRRQRPKAKRERPDERRPIVRLPKPEHERGRTQERRGVVVSSAMEKTIVVKVDTVKAHPRYKKVVRRSRKYHAHDEANTAKVGDVVRIVETRPLSKTKNWRLAEIVEAAR